MRSNKYTILFAFTLSLVLSMLLSGVYMLLKDRQDENRALEKQQSILHAAKIEFADNQDAKNLFQKRVETMVVDKKGELIKGATDAQADGKSALLIYAIKNEAGQVESYVYPVLGSGLWSKLYGYLAVDKLGKNVLGLIFYKQGETPGLGAEIEKEWFVQNFDNKTLFNENKLVGVRVAKGSAARDPSYKFDSSRLVDGISGATITGNGISDMMVKEPLKYEPFFQKIRSQERGNG